MHRQPIMLFVVLTVLGLAAAGLLAIGAFPPTVASSPVERTLGNDRFQTR